MVDVGHPPHSSTHHRYHLNIDLTSPTPPSLYVLIGNIPLDFHTPDIRNFFAYAIENETFECFNYRHRPHTSRAFNICICKIKAYKFDELVKLYDKKNWLNSSGLLQKTKCSIVKIKVSGQADATNSSNTVALDKISADNDLKRVVGESDMSNLLEFKRIPDWMPQGNVGTPTRTFVKYINQCIMPQSLIAKLGINLSTFRKHKKRIYSNVNYTYEEAEDDYEYEYDYDVDNNDTTMGVEVATTASGDRISEAIDDEKLIDAKNYASKLKTMAAKRVDLIEEEEEDEGKEMKAGEGGGEEDNEVEEWERHEALHDDVTKQDRTSPYFFENEIELKWEKGGSGLVFYTDDNFWKEHENKDFDAETADDLDVDMSVYYEANGGDKDARELLDINREAIVRNGRDDKLLDEASMQRSSQFNPFRRTNDKRRKKRDDDDGGGGGGGCESKERGVGGIGSFEKYTKGFGRRQLEKQGWKDGQAVGNPSRDGLKDALDASDGKPPHDKKGLGYAGERVDRERLTQLSRLNRLKAERRNNTYYIATKYDDVALNQPDTLLRRVYPPVKYNSSDSADKST